MRSRCIRESKILLKIVLVLVGSFCAELHLRAEGDVKSEFDARIKRMHDRISDHERLLLSTEWELMRDYIWLFALKDLFNEISEFQDILKNCSISAFMDIEFRSQRHEFDVGVFVTNKLDEVATVLSGFSSQLHCGCDNVAKLRLARTKVERMKVILNNKIEPAPDEAE